MAWFGDSLSSLSNLKGQITNFTKEVLSDGIVDEIDERSKALKEANERCSQLQDLLTTKDAEISLLRRQNCELQKTIIEINAKSKESWDAGHADEAEGIFWDPSCVDNRNTKNQSHVRQLQEQLAQATVKVRELECELKHVQKVNNASFKDDISDGYRKAEVVRAKQDMLNRIIQMEEKTREAERNAKHMQLDEASLISDFRSVISKLNSREKFDLVSGALKALQIEHEAHEKIKDHEKSNEELGKIGGFDNNPLVFKHTSLQQPHNVAEELLVSKEEMLQKRIEELQNENKDLLDAMEKLDKEHTQSIEKLLSLKEESNKKHRSLQNAYEQLSIDYNEVQKSIIELRNDMLKHDENTCTEVIHQSVQTDNADKSDKRVQVTVSSQEVNGASKTNVLDDITEKVKIILKNCTISSIEPGESIFEAVAKQYVDAKWKLNVLERKVTEVTRDLNETEEMKDSLRMTCEELQSHIHSLLLEKNMRIKSCQGNLPSIPEASEERVASLEMDVESLREEVKRLLAENKTIRETNSTLLAIQSNQVPLTDNDESQGDKNSKLHTYVKENKELPIALEKSKSSDEDMTSIEQLKLDYENVEGELNLSVSTTKLSETDLASLHVTINKLAEENKHLLQKNKHLDMQLHDKTLRERDLQEENNYLLENLRERFDVANREKLGLENDILHKEKELDAMQIQVDMRQFEITKFSQDNDRLIKENISLSEQLTATHNESLDKIELLNTEMSLLQQEYEDLKQEILIYKEELPMLKEKLYKAQEHYTKLENKYYALKMQSEHFELHKKGIQSQTIEIEQHGNESSLKEPSMEELSSLRNRCELLEQEIEMVRKETHKFDKNGTEIPSTNKNQINKGGELLIAEDSLVGTEKYDLITKNTNIMCNEWQMFKSIVDEERREKHAIKEHNKNLMDEINDLRNKLQIAFENNKESAEMAKQTIEDISHIIREKDQEISILQAEIIRAKNIIAQSSNDLTVIKNQKNEVEQLISVKHNESLQYQNEIQKLVQRVNEQAVHIQELISERTANKMRHKSSVEDQGDHDRNGIDHSKQNPEITALNKKCDALEIALMQEQSNTRILQNQLAEVQNKESNSAKELERLRTHLVEMESSYTEEALIAESNRQELETRLLQAEEKVKSSSTALTSANIRANQQVETLQQQIALITQQRDQIQAKLSATEDNIQLQSASLTNLQIVLEQFQQDKERDVMAATEKLRSQIVESHEKQNKLSDDVSNLQQQLFEARECLKAASRLSEQLEKKDEQIERLNEEVAQLTASLNFADQKVKEVAEYDEGKVDKVLVKNLLLGYLFSTTSDKSSILRVFANVLDFSESEKDKTGLKSMTTHGSKNSDMSLKDQEASLSTAFVRFLESESKPKPQLPALPMMNSPSTRPGHKQQSLSSSSLSQSTSLFSNVTLPTFPDFIPARNTGSILKEVLKDS